MIYYEFILFVIAFTVLITITVIYANNNYDSKILLQSEKITNEKINMNLQTKRDDQKYFVTISLLKGGFGNQLFKIATAYAYAKNTDKELVFDIEEATFPYAIENVKYFDSFYSWTKNLNTSDYKWEVYTEKEGFYNEIPLFHGNVRLEGYFQSPRYFNDYKIEILNLFYNNFFVNIPLHLNFLKSPEINTVCVHFRYIDYVGNPQFDVLPEDYYRKSIGYIKENIVNPLFVIFSDQIEYCKQNMTDLNCIFIEEGHEIDQHLWMTLCKHHIIPNSTYSWWAAYKNETGTVILPKMWCNPKFGNVWNDLKLRNWITIN